MCLEDGVDSCLMLRDFQTNGDIRWLLGLLVMRWLSKTRLLGCQVSFKYNLFNLSHFSVFPFYLFVTQWKHNSLSFLSIYSL
jgi:hypothetical protein